MAKSKVTNGYYFLELMFDISTIYYNEGDPEINHNDSEDGNLMAPSQSRHFSKTLIAIFE